MEISAKPATAPSPVRISEVNGRLAALRAMQKAMGKLPERSDEVQFESKEKGRLLDLRC